jgi:hypothetical protein
MPSGAVAFHSSSYLCQRLKTKLKLNNFQILFSKNHNWYNTIYHWFRTTSILYFQENKLKVKSLLDELPVLISSLAFLL